MSEESSDNRFVERRSAHADFDEVKSSTDTKMFLEPEPSSHGSSSGPETEAAVEKELPDDQPAAAEIDLEEMARVEVPEPSFYEIVQPLEIQALQFLGELPLTSDGRRGVLPAWAKHVIDLLGILEERTRGNLTPEESQYLEQVLSDLRIRYVRASS
jgi:hypothetical protein